jgi:chemotaxis protein methyltransferase WspC
MSMAAIEALLNQTMGLDAASVGAPMLQRAVQERLQLLGLHDTADYLGLLQRSDVELQELIEGVVVPETWFFRDQEVFAALVQLAQEQLRQQPRAELRLLSLPCSTGEEPYSMVMALLDAGIAPDRFAVDAVDISAQALAKAQCAVYGRNSFRSSDTGFRARHFDTVAQGSHLHEAVRRKVRFRQGNLFAPGFLPEAAVYDVIFCRNVLIYFDAPTQERALAVLDRLLKPGGLLFVGSSESALLLRPGFTSVKLPMVFAFRKQAGQAPQQSSPEKALPRHAPRPPPRPAPRAAAPAPRLPPAKAPPVAPDTALDEAGMLANRGRLDEAAHLCEQHLRQFGPSAAAFHLLGLVHDASGRQERAGHYYRKALYLEPAHHEALIHLAVLLEKQGDTAGARRLYDRARRGQAGDRAPTGGRHDGPQP